MSTDKPKDKKAVKAEKPKDDAAAGAKATDKDASKRGRATARKERVKRAPNPERRRRLLIGLAVVVAVIAMLYRPTRDLYIAWRTGYTLESRYEALAEENEQLNSDIDRLMTHEGIEDAARERGYVMPGETSVKVEGLENVTETDETEASENSGELPWYIHVGDAIFFFSEGE